MGLYTELLKCIYSQEYERSEETYLFVIKLYKSILFEIESKFPEYSCLFNLFENILLKSYPDLTQIFSQLMRETIKISKLYRRDPILLPILRLSMLFERLCRSDMDNFFRLTKDYITDYFEE